MLTKIKKIVSPKLLKQIFKFGIVGICAFGIDYILLYVFVEFLNIHHLIASALSFIVSLIFNYIASIKWVFDVNQKQTYKEVMVFAILSIIGLGINQIVMYVMTDLWKVYYMISKLVATAIVMVWNFITRKIFIEK